MQKLYSFAWASWIASVAIAFGLGYYWGMRNGVRELVNMYRAESFSDAVAAGFCRLYELQGDHDATTSRSSDEEEDEPSRDREMTDIVEHDREDNVEDAASDIVEQQHDEGITPRIEKKYYAQLASYTARKPSEMYVSKLRGLGIPSKVVELQGRQRRGTPTKWYKVVTDGMAYDTLCALVESLEKRDRLAGVVIAEEKL